jgi:hypothetical protein
MHIFYYRMTRAEATKYSLVMVKHCIKFHLFTYKNCVMKSKLMKFLQELFIQEKFSLHLS